LGAMAAALFLFLVALGLPLLSGGRGGLGVFMAPSAGFLMGFVVGAFVTGVIMSRLKTWPVALAAGFSALIGGVGAVYALGIPVLAWHTGLSLTQAALSSAIFLPGDLLKVFATAVLARGVYQASPSLFAVR
jgi:biotin transport system substrate-specific component